MSGRDSLRGYVFQTIISVMKALSDDSWEYVSIEPSTPEDKVDIIWTNISGYVHCEQVKSSIKNFGKPDIIRWIEEMINDVPVSNGYRLTLVGNVATGVDSFIHSIRKKEAGFKTDNQLLDDYLSKTSVELIPFNAEILEDVITTQVSKFLSSEGFQLPHSAHNLIAGGLIYQFFQFSIFEKRIHRTEVAEIMIEWAKRNYQKAFGVYTHSRNLLLSCYTSDGNWENTISLSPCILNLSDISYFYKATEEMFEAFQSALQYELPERNIDEPLPETSPFSMNFIQGKPVSAEFDDAWKDFISTKFKAYFDLEIPAGLFNVGNLNKIYPTVANMLFQGIKYEGAEHEKKKHEHLRKFYFRLKEIDELFKCIENLESYLAIPVAVQNAGSFDENITVEIKIPGDIQLLSPENFYIPEDADVLESLMDDNFLNKIMRQKSNSTVSEYRDTIPYNYMKMPSFDIFNPGPDLKYMKSVFRNATAKILDNEIFTDRPGFILLKYTYSTLNPHESVFLPTYLFLKSVKPFAIEYSITSKHTIKVTKGTLNITPKTENKDGRSLYQRLMHDMKLHRNNT